MTYLDLGSESGGSQRSIRQSLQSASSNSSMRSAVVPWLVTAVPQPAPKAVAADWSSNLGEHVGGRQASVPHDCPTLRNELRTQLLVRE